MTIQWHYENRPGVGLLSLSGFLGEQACPRFAGAVGWALTRGQGTLIVDLTGLQGWSEGGQETLAAAAGRLAEQGRSLELAGVPVDNAAFTPRAGDPDIRCHRNLEAALAAHPGPAGR
ncbi:STAS domain-containing protein [Streptomyces sp. H39-S7]|uniref:STAS domain-containing protein n=1 Tax=Streptomyces sp. H39-S7 TaxID=3004357 RepID=UPI0022B0755A|nr:STAS domain-containing protein [Streptomyces sp. H39-S7]MCZ4121081.1 STAS domain-containing protein [Streptomyces sp. H39-S7]